MMMRSFFPFATSYRAPKYHAAAFAALTSRPSSTSAGPSTSAAGSSASALRRRVDEGRSKTPDRWRTSMSTKLSHAGLSEGPGGENAPLSPPIDLATTYERPPGGDYGDGGLIYSRSCNPTRKLLEKTLGKLEMASMDDANGDASAPTYAFSSGMAAVASLLLACKSPVKLLIPKDVYHGVPTQLHASLDDHGVAHESVDMTDCDELRRKINDNVDPGGTLVVWMETPSNPLCQVTDIGAVCDAARDLRSEHENSRILTVVDSTWAPPCITQPLRRGADAVLHSGTKYLAGHSDALLGTVSCSPLTGDGRWLADRLGKVQWSVGAVASPLECWLALRGLRTLHLRVERQCQTAMELARYLDGHGGVTRCHYPGLGSHPQHEVATKQMIGTENGDSMYGGMVSFEVEGEAMAMAVAGAVHIIRRATSLGGTETLIEHRASIEPPERQTSPPGLLRLSVGLENVKDLRHDLEVALDVASRVMNSNNG